MCYKLLFCFFFFKQKTAYEMRISDWSSDVCSSDLGADPETMAATVATPLERQFSQIPGVDVMTSDSSVGTSRITLQFALERNIDAAAQDVQTAIAQARRQLPTAMPHDPHRRQTNPAASPNIYICMHTPNIPRP